ncbi:MAG: sulfite exporter TauE/SafE family protein [Microgenomates group bacterium]|jgi:sulfite exporter TauE/SafE|nr:sulfite exporter TauE/SafE family protein [Candidatus Woesebacteria bacterium]MBP6883071.1 sulfite exporter TauE/SafE family protein [Candidatus Woesebacteria bacterium]QQR63853.1 MAG: sulfite exporter TauE/SafE family protein [Candidatus Roizmanbacteria bacterium]
MQEINLFAIFITGLVTGGLTCLAVQGGLLTSMIAQRESTIASVTNAKGQNAVPILSFLFAKLIAYTFLGFLLGWLGAVVQLSLSIKVFLQFAVVVFMLGTAMNILNVHPIFRYFVIQPPRFLTRLVRRQSKRTDLFAPMFLGAFTVFIPCGTTQAMMALAIATGNPIIGATILFVFILGTSPLFFILGYFASKLGEKLHNQFMQFAAVTLILLAAYNFYGALALTGYSFSDKGPQQNLVASDTPTISINEFGYSPNAITVKANSDVSLRLDNKNGSGCIQAFTIPALGIQKIVPLGSSATVTFRAPNQKGTMPFMCSMGMYRGVINII